MAVLIEGDIWVTAKTAVVHGDAANYNTTTGEIGATGTAIPGSRWMTSADSGAIALLRLTRTPDGL
jgi:hypothetical protein